MADSGARQEGPTLLQAGSDQSQTEAASATASSRNLRHILQRNNVERATCERQTKTIEHQRRTVKSQLDREEKELRHQLEKLHKEQELFSRLDSLQDEQLVHHVTSVVSLGPQDTHDDVTEPDVTEFDVTEHDVINPYPVALRPRVSSARDAHRQRSSADAGTPAASTRRRLSVEFEDLTLVTSTGKILPPLTPHSQLPLVASLKHSDSMVLPPAEESPREQWAGSPDAIHSVRRPRRSVAQQRLDHLLVRATGAPSLGGQLSRSQSLKERAAVRKWTRSHSWKERRVKDPGGAPGEGGDAALNQALSMMELSSKVNTKVAGKLHAKVISPRVNSKGGNSPLVAGGGGPASRGSPVRSRVLYRQSSCHSLTDYVCTPETKSAVWGRLEVPPPEALQEGGTSLLHRRRKMAPPNLPAVSTDRLPPSPLHSPSGQSSGPPSPFSRGGSTKRKT